MLCVTKNLCLIKHKLFVYSQLEYSPMFQKTGVQIKVDSYQRLKKMVLDAALLNTQHYKVRIRGKVG